ncbi:PhzF family phenazine biosynthesis protein [Maritalea mediterranea]|uniref:PhzF family phenazine biosynthesis protein n=1 Tax=Maritalea mediterranea TaxID=2909667 RepID=A0ABS9E2C8_9HYPH|nr:PhzF family phenazine biosynthesis protein [Maritalea mediterranea]MCF4097017.1 PhzF family phenazine biosynthesis protein [Maritalea mediterranea]
MEIFQVDAFTANLFKGNPAAVMVVENWLDGGLMQHIAMENNLSETAFVRKRDDESGWDIRWFTPTHEVSFCGHATLASAHILHTEYQVPMPLTFFGQVGELVVSLEKDDPKSPSYQLNFPVVPFEEIEALPDAIGPSFSATPRAIFKSYENYFVELADEAAVRGFAPDLAALAQLGTTGVVITAQGDEFDFVSRYFVPGAGIDEDPVTGSIHTSLVPYWAEKLGKSDFQAHQASERGGNLTCRLNGDRVQIVGSATTYLRGNLCL